MTPLIDQQSLGKLRFILSASDFKPFVLLTVICRQMLTVEVTVVQTLLTKGTTLSLDVMTVLTIACIYRTERFSHTPIFWPKSAFSVCTQLSSCVNLFPHCPVFIAFLSIQGRRRTAPVDRSTVVTPAASKVNHLYGVKAWKCWVQQRNKQLREREPHCSSLRQLHFRISVLIGTNGMLFILFSFILRSLPP